MNDRPWISYQLAAPSRLLHSHLRQSMYECNHCRWAGPCANPAKTAATGRVQNSKLRSESSFLVVGIGAVLTGFLSTQAGGSTQPTMSLSGHNKKLCRQNSELPNGDHNRGSARVDAPADGCRA